MSRPDGADAPQRECESYRFGVNVVGTGPSVVLAPGLGMPASSMDPLVRELSLDHTVVTFDRPGLGRLAHRPRRSPPTLAGEVERMAAALATARSGGATGPAVLVGHSMAGFVVEAFAREHPRDTAGVVVLDGSVEEDRPVPAARVRLPLATGRALVAIPLLPGTGVVRRAGAALVEDAGYPGLAADLHRVRGRARLPDVPVRVLAAVWHPATWHASAWLDRQHDLVRVLAAGHPRGAEGVTFTVVERSGHHVARWQPRPVLDAIRALRP